MSKIFFRDIDTKKISTAFKIAKNDIADYPSTHIVKIEKLKKQFMKLTKGKQ